MSQNNNNTWTFIQKFAIIVGIIAGFSGIISATIAVLTYLENRPSQDYTQTQPSDRPIPRVDWKKTILVKTLTGHSN